MTNEQRAEKIIEKFGFDFGNISKSEISALIEQEIADYHPGSSEYIRLLCGYLYCLGSEADIPLLEKAKYKINMDVGCMIDGEWIDSLRGVTNEYVRPRKEIIEDFVDYYRNFKADDTDDEW